MANLNSFIQIGANTGNFVGNITSANIVSTGIVSATGNVRGANFNTVGDVNATGNITANTYTGNGSQLTGVANVSSVKQVLGLTMIYGGR
jgi:hypothetical protein